MDTKNKTVITAEHGKQEVVITREFDAPRELVFKAFTDPKLLVQWLGPMSDLTEAGWNESFDKLAASLAKV